MIVVYLDAYSRRFFFIFGEVIIFSCIFFKLNYSDARLFFFFFYKWELYVCNIFKAAKVSVLICKFLLGKGKTRYEKL